MPQYVQPLTEADIALARETHDVIRALGGACPLGHPGPLGYLPYLGFPCCKCGEPLREWDLRIVVPSGREREMMDDLIALARKYRVDAQKVE